MSLKPALRKFGRAADRLVGLGGFNPSQRRRATAAQFTVVVQMLPIMAIGSVAATGPMVYAAMDHAHFSPVIALLGVNTLLQAYVMRVWWRFRRIRGVRDFGGTHALNRIYLIAVMAGLVWGGLVAYALPDADTSMLIIVTAVLSSAMLLVCFVLAPVAGAMLLFVGTGTTCALAGLVPVSHQAVAATAVILVLIGLVFLPWAGIYLCRTFIARIRLEIRNKEEADVTRHLLEGYEATASEWFWEIDDTGMIVRVSPRLCNRLDINPDQAQETALFPLMERIAAPGATGIGLIEDALARTQPFDGVEVTVTIQDETRWWRVSGRPAVIDSLGAAGYVGTVSDITAEKATESKIIQLAHRDTLTGLFNRASFTERLDGAVKTLERYGTPFTLLFLDLDKFKLVNDTYGHPTGDKLLTEIADRIAGIVRAQDCVARLGGDEFAIIVERSNDAVFAAKLAARLIAEVLEPYEIDGETLWIGVSAGIALAPQHGTRPEQILRNADLALYRAKEDGRGVFRYFEAQMDFAQRERRMLEREMHQALEGDEFRLCYQPMISADSGRICCMEALIRWDHPIRGEISPVEFIAIAEQSNLIVEIGKWTLLAACRAATEWPDHVSVSVNVAATHFMRSEIVTDVAAALERTGLAGTRLEIEITESLLIEDSEDVIARLAALKQLGCSVVMDDFGTGYSSLSYLLKYPFDRLKIDRSFVSDIGHGPSAKAILMAIASLAENLGMKITAEGVETAEQLAFLQQIACDQLQGYYFSPPVRDEAVATMMLHNFIETATVIPICDGANQAQRSVG